MYNQIAKSVPRKYAPLPVPGLPVQVQCDGFKCMAFRTPDGRWVNFFSREIMPRVIGVIPPGVA